VSDLDKAQVPSDFDRVARTYDFLTTRDPWYVPHLRTSAARLGLGPGARVLDLCCGTGLSTQAILDAYPDAEVTALDASEGMLAIARKKKLAERARFVLGDAMDPAKSAGVEAPFDGVLMAYGIRNVPDADACLDNVRSLLAPGGRVCFHEYSVADSARARATFTAVSFGVIIPGGLLTSGSTKIYRYLWKSVLAFDGVRAFEERLRRHGFVGVRTLPMGSWHRGILHTFVAERAR
jgi:ubiquinone/menaquinone biosynthesis C-methylase UbiE